MFRLEGAYFKAKSIDCKHCGARAQFVRCLPDIARGAGELRSFVCIACHKETEIAAD
jgi:hypothetical protein